MPGERGREARLGGRTALRTRMDPDVVVRPGPPRTEHAEPTPPATLDDTRQRIRTLVGIAASNGSTISSEELRVLLPPGMFPSAQAMEGFLLSDGRLAGELQVSGGEVTIRGAEDLIAKRVEQRFLTEERLARADRFVAGLERLCPSIELVGISGSVAYGGTKAHDDVDVFLVTGRHRMWACLLLAMTAARLDRMKDPASPLYCFNRATERPECEESFRASREPLFAREALNLKILRGGPFYRELLAASPWMAAYFPSLFESRATESGGPNAQAAPRGGPHWRMLNLASFLLLAPYLWTAGLVRNRRLGRDGRDRARFRTVVEPAFCAYESKKYDDLREEYRRTF